MSVKFLIQAWLFFFGKGEKEGGKIIEITIVINKTYNISFVTLEMACVLTETTYFKLFFLWGVTSLHFFFSTRGPQYKFLQLNATVAMVNIT